MSGSERTILAGRVVRGDTVLLPDGGKRIEVTVTRATRGYRPQDHGKPPAQRPRRRLEGPGADGLPRTWLRPFAEELPVVRLVTDA